MEKTKYHSYKNGILSEGCKQCIEGRKTVLFITGLCSQKCFYCPISDQKKDQDKIFANEKEIKEIKEIIEEIKKCGSKGVGITGGDPLEVLDRTINAIKEIKKYDAKMHIHLYTPLFRVNKETLKKLYEAGLDEIRFHPLLENQNMWDRIKIAKEFKWNIGIEIPVIPKKEKEIENLISYFKDTVEFFNLNELEIADAESCKILQEGYKPKDDISYGVKGSEETAVKILKKFPNVRIHYCTAKLKDRVQLRKRLINRAKNVKLNTDELTKEGTLIRGAIYTDTIKPGFKYNESLEKLSLDEREKVIKELKQIKEKIDMMKIENYIDEKRLRLLVNHRLIKKIAKQIKNCAVAEEYPSEDNMIVEIEFFS